MSIRSHITELDISVYPKEHNARERKSEDAKTDFTTEKENAQWEKCTMCFDLFKKYPKSITSITIWNLSDKYSCLDNFPVRNRKDYPLLLDYQLKPKKAYREVVKIAK